MKYIYLHLLVLRAPALVWNYPKERFTFDRMKRKSGSVCFCRKGWRSWAVPSKWQLNPSDCLFFRGNFSLSHAVQLLLVKACLISRSMIVYMCLCVRKCHCLNLHGDDVPFSPAPAGIRGRRGGGEEAGGQSLKRGGKTSGVFGALKRIRLPKNIQLNLPFRISCGVASKVNIVTMATHADTNKVLRLCQLKN